MSGLDVVMLPGAQIDLSVDTVEMGLVVVDDPQVELSMDVVEMGLVVVGAPGMVDLIEVLPEQAGAYTRRVEVVGPGLVYRGDAPLCSSEDAPVWRIRQITLGAEGVPIVRRPRGSDAFEFLWVDRATYQYE